ncbi:hypothetical protein HAX54_051649, partial [Datura stramonium]|nr:hypothetical protein [Datura stramonium]
MAENKAIGEIRDNRQLEQQIGKRSTVLEQRHDQCMVVAIRSGKTTIEQPIPRMDPNEEENISNLVEAGKRSDAMFDSHVKGFDAT